MYYDILDKKRIEILPHFEFTKKKFYLAGGTSLALQIGHRDSVDFDFFSDEEFDTKKIFEETKENFKDHKLTIIQEEKNTLTVLVNDFAKVSFFYYPYKLVADKIETPYFNIAGEIDIGCMKLSEITSRATNKDYVDLFYILQKIKLEELLKVTSKKIPELDKGLILKSLVYFEDIKIDPIKFKHNKEVLMKNVKKFIVEEVKKLKI